MDANDLCCASGPIQVLFIEFNFDDLVLYVTGDKLHSQVDPRLRRGSTRSPLWFVLFPAHSVSQKPYLLSPSSEELNRLKIIYKFFFKKKEIVRMMPRNVLDVLQMQFYFAVVIIYSGLVGFTSGSGIFPRVGRICRCRFNLIKAKFSCYTFVPVLLLFTVQYSVLNHIFLCYICRIPFCVV